MESGPWKEYDPWASLSPNVLCHEIEPNPSNDRTIHGDGVHPT
jgi:hypothetical protein